MVRPRCLFRLMSCLWLVTVALPLVAATFDTIRLEPRLAPAGWENARRYEIAYLATGGEELGEPDFPLHAKAQEIDFIMAGVVRELLAREYGPKGVKADTQAVATATADEILSLAAGRAPGRSPAWDPANLENLARYLQTAPDSLMLYKAVVRVEGADGSVAEETVPLLVRFKQCPGQRDLLSLFFVTTTPEPARP
ncbi:MAG: hypothetical protein GX442_21190 [Candidatus Riflebacteria bacterium]|nr:hypothetical protein [Candidatus Riflebacteria bacterium]